MPNTTRIIIRVTVALDVAPGVNPMVALDDVLTAAERGARRACTDATAGVTRIRFDANLDNAKVGFANDTLHP